MASYEEVLKAILDAAGNPTSGALKDFAPALASAVVAIDHPAGRTVRASVDLPHTAEVRVLKATERRQK